MKALVTGASGFIGPHLVPLLTGRDVNVRAMVQAGEDVSLLEGLDTEIVTGDVRDFASLAAAVQGVDVVFHLAGLLAARNQRQLLEINERGTDNMARACAERITPPAMLLVSSLAAAGPATNGRPRTELDPPRPVSNYGRSKRAGELAARRWAARVPLTIIRPPMVFGEGDRHSRWLFRPIARRGIHAVPGRQQRQISLIHVDDMCLGLCLAAERGARVDHCQTEEPARGVYFLAAEQDLDYGELGQRIGSAVGRRRVRVVRAPGWLGYCAASAGEVVSRISRRPTLFNVDKMREALAGSWTCSAARIRAELGFAVGRSLDERLLQTAQWYAGRGLL
jgi:nucleoside-diphosphate-sugar epimerase